MATTILPKGSEEQRRIWKVWARASRLTDQHDNFRSARVDERRRVFRDGLDSKDTNLLKIIEKVQIDIVHFRNSVTERWPETIRVMLNDASGDGAETHPFESWVGPPGLEKRKQSTRVWTELIQFLVLEYHINNVSWHGDAISIRGEQGFLGDIGFILSDNHSDDLMDIVEGSMYSLKHVEDAVHEFCLQIIMQKNPTPQNNALLLWVALLLQTEEFGDQPRLEFCSLKDELTMKEKLEALVHYARVLVLDQAFTSWLRSESVAPEWKTALETAVNKGNYDFCDRGTPRPIEQEGDPTDFDRPYWQAFKAHFNGLRTRWLVKGSNSPIGVILQLL